MYYSRYVRYKLFFSRIPFHATVDVTEVDVAAGGAGDGRGSAARGVEKVGGVASSSSMARRSSAGGESSEEATRHGDGSGGWPSRTMLPG
jgi:hypothetical protein